MTDRPMRIFIAEDEAMVGIVLADYLDELGYAVAGPFGTVRECQAELDRGAPLDCALLDCNLGDGPVWPVARRLAAMGVPFLFASGGDGGERPADLGGRPSLPKPFSMEALAGALAALHDAPMPRA